LTHPISQNPGFRALHLARQNEFRSLLARTPMVTSAQSYSEKIEYNVQYNVINL